MSRRYQYLCLFCVFLGYKSKGMFEDEYLDHISQEHRGFVMNSVVLYKTCCISDHVCADSESYDINLFPLTAEEQTNRRLVDFQLAPAVSENLLDVDEYLTSFGDLRVT